MQHSSIYLGDQVILHLSILYKNNKSINNIIGVELKKIMKGCSIILTLNIQKQLSFKRHHSWKGVLALPGALLLNWEGLNLNI